jgi:hypothetical protein
LDEKLSKNRREMKVRRSTIARGFWRASNQIEVNIYTESIALKLETIIISTSATKFQFRGLL